MRTEIDALHAPLHLAVTHGPGVGLCHGLASRERSVGRDADVSVPDPLLSRRHLAVAARGGRSVVVRDLGSTNGTRVASPRRPRPDGTPRWQRPTAVGRRGRRVRVGGRIIAGAGVLEVRPHPGGAQPIASDPGAERGPSTGRRLDSAMRILPPLAGIAVLVPFLATGTSPWRWAILALPLTLAGVGIASLVSARTHRPPRPADAPDVLLALLRGVPLRREDRRGGGADAHDTPPSVLPWHLPGEPARPWRSGESVGVCGPEAAAVARWIALRAAASCPPGTCDVTMPGEAPRTAPASGSDGAWTVEVLPARGLGTVAQAPRPRTVRVVFARHRRHLPPWCTHVLDVPRAPGTVPDELWARDVLGLARARGAHDPDDASRAPAAALLDLLGPDLADAFARGPERTAAVLARRWRRAPAGLRVPLGLTTDDGEVVGVDLVADGPHALVAGTTGSGKSEALITWVLGLALTHSPERLQLLLVDHKGGATFAGLAGLPHVAGMLTDLDAQATDRALRSLAAEVARRERILAEAGMRDIAERDAAGADPATLPRLVVLVDEFRVLADSHPGLMDVLRRIAAQGRTLGMHLVLATQRPAGAVGPDLRANIPLRLCLRVLETADSTDVLGSPEGAQLPRVPGLAWVRCGDLRRVRLAWAGSGETMTRVAVLTARAAWAATGLALPARPWAPPLPEHVSPDLHASARPGRWRLGIADLPDEQRHGVAEIDPRGGVLVVGPAGSGRTAAARAILAEAVRAGGDTHVLTAAPLPSWACPPAELRRGTWVSARDPRRARLLLETLLDDGSDGGGTGGGGTGGGGARGARRGGGALVVVDDVEAVAELLETGMPAGTGTDLLERLVRDGGRQGLCVVLTGGPHLASARRWAGLATRLVLGNCGTETVLLDLPKALAAGPRPPGRGVLVGRGDAVAVQVAWHEGPDAALPVPSLPAPSSPSVLTAPAQPAAPGPAEILDIRPLPRTVSHSLLTAAAARSKASLVACGAGGLDGGPVLAPLDARRPWFVVGPPGSGRTAVLAAVETWCRAQGRPVVHAGGESPLPAAAALTRGAVLLVDDADPMRMRDAEDLARDPAAGAPALVVTGSDHQIGPHATGLAARATGSGTVVVLAPARSGERAARAAADPLRPGVAVVLHRGRATACVVAHDDGVSAR